MLDRLKQLRLLISIAFCDRSFYLLINPSRGETPMANETPKNATVSAADVAKDLSASVVLTKTDETKAAADAKVAEAAAPQVAVQAAAPK